MTLLVTEAMYQVLSAVSACVPCRAPTPCTSLPGDDDAASLSDGSDVAEPSFPSRPPTNLRPRPPPPLPSMSMSMAPKPAESSVATLGIPSALGASAGNRWMEAVEADALQVPRGLVFTHHF